MVLVFSEVKRLIVVIVVVDAGLCKILPWINVVARTVVWLDPGVDLRMLLPDLDQHILG